MLLVCGHCNKQQALVHVAEILEREGKKGWNLRHLCEGCARELGLPNSKLMDSLLLLPQFPGFAGMTDTACPQCSLRFSEFRRAGRLGCEKCYEVFSDILKDLLEKAHAGRTRHVGRRPGPSGQESARRDDLASLQRRLKTAVETEDYEEAARLRDRIRELGEAAP